MFSKSCEYAIRAVLYLAIHSSFVDKLSIKAVAKKLEIPSHFLGKLLQPLVHNGVISSMKGKNGGFYVSEDQQQKTLMDIVVMFDGRKPFNRCTLGLTTCSDEKPCPIHTEIKPYKSHLENIITTKTIAELASDVKSGIAHLTLTGVK